MMLRDSPADSLVKFDIEYNTQPLRFGYFIQISHDSQFQLTLEHNN